MEFIKKHKTFILLLAILALAFFFRFWQLDSIPPGLYPDEAIHGNNASEAIETGDYKVFYPENNGREGLFINLIAFSFRIFGPHIWAIRLVSAIFGFLTVLGLYLLTKEIFRTPGVANFSSRLHQNRRLKSATPKEVTIALLAAFFLSISFWHVNFSRIGFRGIMVPFCLVWSFWFLFKGLKGQSFLKRTVLYFVLSGLFFGLGFHTYISFRVAPLILIVLLAAEFIRYWKKNKPEKLTWSWLWKKFYLKDGWWKWDIFFLIIIIIALPLGIYFLQNPGTFMGRAGDVSIFKAEHPLKELGLSIVKTLGMFNIYGDGNWRHNFAGQPQLLWPVGILFLIGLVLSIKYFINLLRKKINNVYYSNKQALASDLRGLPSQNLSSRQARRINFDFNLFTVYCLLLTWFIIMLLPSFLSAEAVPHALRAIGVIPVVYIFAALGFYWLITKLFISFQKYQWTTKRILFAVYCLLFTVLIVITGVQYDKYFIRWARHREVQGAFTQKFVGIGNLLNTLDKDWLGFIIVNESGAPVPIKPELTINYYEGKTIPMPAQTVMFVTHEKANIKFILPEDMDEIIIKDSKAVIIPLAPSQELFDYLKQKFPQGAVEKINEIYVYKI